MKLTDLNHNQLGNPHPQYGDFTYELATPSSEYGWNLIAEQDFENTLGTGTQTKPLKIVGGGLLYGGKVGGLQEMFNVSFTFIANSTDSYNAFCSSTPLMNSNRVKDAIRLVVDKNGNAFTLKVYVKSIGWNQTFFRPTLLDPIEWIQNTIPLFANKRMNLKTRCDDFYNRRGSATISNPTGLKVIFDKSDLSKQITATKTDDINADDSNMFLVQFPNGGYVNKILNGGEGQIVTLYGDTSNTNTINSMANIHASTSVTNILIKDGSQKVLTQNTFRNFKKTGEIWIEV